MATEVIYKIDSATLKDISSHLNSCKLSFIPALDSYVDIEEYSSKIREKGRTFEAWIDRQLIGLIAAYLNTSKKNAYITNVSVDPKFQGNGIAKKLLFECKELMKKNGISEINLEVKKQNLKAMEFYLQNDFLVIESSQNIKMKYKSK